jgi:cystathionine beta-synthase
MRENRLLVDSSPSIESLLGAKTRELPSLIAVAPDTSIRQALGLIEEHNVSQLPVLRDRECVGSVSESGLMANLVRAPELIDTPVEDVMEAPFPVVEAGAEFELVTRELVAGRSAVIVRSHGEPDGIITRFDVVHYLIGLGN